MIISLQLLFINYHKLNDQLCIITIGKYRKEIQDKIIYYVCLNSKYHICKRTIQRFQSYIKGVDGDLLFTNVVKSLKLDVIKLLLDNGANIHVDNDDALRFASYYGHLHVVKLLLEKGANIHADHDYALRFSSTYGQLKVVRLLLEKGADIHAENDFSLKFASSYGHLHVVELLIDKGANIHAENDYALRFASYYGQLTVVKLLLEKGANLHAENNEAIRSAVKNGYFDMVEFFLKMDKTQKISFTRESRFGYLNLKDINVRPDTNRYHTVLKRP